MLTWLTDNWQAITAILGLAGGLGGVSLWARRLRAIIAALVVGIETYDEKMTAGTGTKPVKEEVQTAAEAAGVESTLKKIVIKETE